MPATALRPEQYDVVVVGARCAGAATGLLLARRGLRVLVLDAAREGSDTGSTHALMRGAVLQLHRWGLLDAVVAAGTPAVRHTVFRYGEDRVDVSIRPAYGVDALVAPRRYLLDRLLADAARDAGAEVRFGARVTEVLTADGRASGVVVREGGRVREVHARLVVGADGVRSRVARAVQAPVTVAGRSAATTVYGYFADLRVVGYEWSYRPGATAGLIPTNNGLTVAFAAVRPERLAATERPLHSAFPDLLALASPDFAERVRMARPAEYLRRHPPVAGFLRRATGPGWALVGDAGYYKDPVTAHGITDALRDAELLADAVVAAGGEAAHPAFADYEATRDRLSRPLLEVTDGVAALDWDLGRVHQLLRGLSSAMAVEVEHIGTHLGTDRDELPTAG
jgi:2-polyprenyl-6-methoxyphenol hydroxylase-like FAD-dependent oxidoreductase